MNLLDILSTSLGNEYGQQMRIQILILWFKGLKTMANRVMLRKKVCLARRARTNGQLFFPLTQLEGDPLFWDNFPSYERGLKGCDKTRV